MQIFFHFLGSRPKTGIGKRNKKIIKLRSFSLNGSTPSMFSLFEFFLPGKKIFRYFLKQENSYWRFLKDMHLCNFYKRKI